jgi:hypothetical protein
MRPVGRHVLESLMYSCSADLPGCFSSDIKQTRLWR